MGSRIFWVLISGVALVTGMVLQDGDSIFRWADDRTDMSARTERAIERGVDRAVDRSVDHMRVVGSDGREIVVDADTKRALGEAVGELAKAEADLAILKIRDAGADELRAATLRRDQARAAVDQLKTEVKAQERAADVQQQVDRQVRDEIRESIRDAVRG